MGFKWSGLYFWWEPAFAPALRRPGVARLKGEAKFFEECHGHFGVAVFFDFGFDALDPHLADEGDGDVLPCRFLVAV